MVCRASFTTAKLPLPRRRDEGKGKEQSQWIVALKGSFQMRTYCLEDLIVTNAYGNGIIVSHFQLVN